MIKFTEAENNKQFISISNFNIPTEKLISILTKEKPNIIEGIYQIDEVEILLALENVTYGFSLNELRRIINNYTPAIVYCFCVDLNLKSQRYIDKND